MESLVLYTNKHRGFTLVEILVTLAILVTILAIGAFANINLFRQEQVLKEEMILVSTLQKARSRAMNNVEQTKHGVHIENELDYYFIFKGDTYNPNDSTNEKIPREEKIILSGLTNIVFKQLSGNANEGNITLTDTGGKQKTIIISENGLIDW